MSEPTAEDHRIAKRLAAQRRSRRRARRLVVVAIVVGLIAGAVAIDLPGRIGQVLASDPVAQPAPVEPVAAAIGIPPEALQATVDYVHDGDTLFIMLGGERLKVRLLAVDTPEVGDNLECYGDEATAYLRGVLPEGSAIRVLADVEPLDQYDRSLLFVWTEAGTLVNLSLVADGYAEALFIGGNRMYEAEVEAAEDAARAARRGLWGAC